MSTVTIFNSFGVDKSREESRALRDRVHQEYQQQLDNIEVAEEVGELLPDWLNDHCARLFIQRSSGRGVKLEVPYNHPMLLEQVSKLAELIPGVDTSYINDGCVWFATDEFIEELPKQRADSIVQQITVAPVRVVYEPTALVGGYQVSFVWFGRLNDQLPVIEVEITYAIHHPIVASLGKIMKEAIGSYRNSAGQISNRYGTAILPAESLRKLTVDGETLAQVAKPINYQGVGDHRRHVVYWESQTGDCEPSATEFFALLKEQSVAT